MTWIEARVNCSVDAAWITLREMLVSDIKRWADLTKADGPTVAQEGNRVIVAFPGAAGESPDRWATIEKNGVQITVRHFHPGDAEKVGTFRLIPRLNRQDAQCRLWIGEQELEFWQVCCRILEPILFP